MSSSKQDSPAKQLAPLASSMIYRPPGVTVEHLQAHVIDLASAHYRDDFFEGTFSTQDMDNQKQEVQLQPLVSLKQLSSVDSTPAPRSGKKYLGDGRRSGSMKHMQ